MAQSRHVAAASLFMILAAGGGVASAANLSIDAQLGVSRAYSTNELWTVWARRSDGTLISRVHGGTGDYIWRTHQNILGNTVHARGVSATGWVVSNTTYERVFYVDSAGLLVKREFQNRVEVANEQIAPPQGKTLSGSVAASWSYSDGGVRYIRCYVTTTQGDLYVMRINESLPSNTWIYLESNMASNTPLAASASPAYDYNRVFAISNDSNVHMWRYDGWAWFLQDMGNPGVGVCGTSATAEAQIDAATYRSYFYCTRRGFTSDRLYIAYATAPDDDTYSWWGSRSVPAPETIRNIGYAIAAVARPDGTNKAIDVWVLNNDSPTTKIYHSKRRSSDGAPTPLVQLGQDGETGLKRGGLAATPRYAFDTWVFYGGRLRDATRLYRRVGDEAYVGSLPSTWADHQVGDPRHTVFGGGSDNPHAESSTAFWKGTAITAAQNTKTSRKHRVEVVWSMDDGDTWSLPAIVMPAPCTGGDCGRGADPVADFTDDGRAHLLVLGASYDDTSNDACGAGVYQEQHVYYQNAVAGQSFSSAVQIDDAPQQADHGWLGIHRTAGNDVLHFAWEDEGSVPTEVRYRSGTWDGTQLVLDPNTWLLSVQGQTSGPTVTVGASGATYVGWVDGSAAPVNGTKPFVICRINLARDGCAARQSFGGPLALFSGYVNGGPGVVGNIPQALSWSIRASPADPDLVHYAFASAEADGDQLDVFFASLTYSDNGTPLDETDDFFTASGRVVVATHEDTDQFSPALTFSRDVLADEHLFVTWYDRRDTCPGLGANRCYRAKRAVSFDLGTTFLYTQDVQTQLSDPANLSSRCDTEPIPARFIGDYHETLGELLHSAHVVVDATGPTSQTISSGWVSGGYYYWQ